MSWEVKHFETKDGDEEDVEEEVPEEEVKKKTPEDDENAQSFDLVEQIGALRKRDQLSDVTFLVGKEKTPFKGHRLIFAARSLIFESMLFPAFPEQEAKLPMQVELPDVEPAAFAALLNFVYTDEVDWDAQVLKHCVDISERYQVDALKGACASFMEGGLNPDNVCTLMESMPAMSTKALRFIESETEAVLKSADFLKLSPASLLRIVKSEKLSVREVDLFKAIMEWGKEEVKRGKATDLKSAITELLPFIRFPTMSTQEIATDVTPTGLLDPPKLLEVFTYLGRVQSGDTSPFTCSFPTTHRFGSSPKIVPFDFAEEDKTNDIIISNNKKKVTFTGSCRTSLYVRGEKPLPTGRLSYFEIRLDQSPGCYSAIGIATPQFNKSLRLGEDANSWAIRLYPNNGTDMTFTGAIHSGQNTFFHNQWNINDRVGILIDAKDNSMTVYKNGAVIGKPFTNIKTKEKLFPCLNLCHSTSFSASEVKSAKKNSKGGWDFNV